LTPKITKKLSTSRSSLLPPVVFSNGSIHLSFTKDISGIPGRPLNLAHDSTMLDSTILKGLNKSGSHHPHYRSAHFSSAKYALPNRSAIIEEEPVNTDAVVKKQDYLTPLDFIELVRTDPEMRDEFCYMLKRGDAYDWEIVDFSQKEKAMHKSSKKLVKSNHHEVGDR
jgi:hypothetical protein